jgi:hypothetical protein
MLSFNKGFGHKTKKQAAKALGLPEGLEDDHQFHS